MFASVIPAIKLPRGFSSFDYLIPNDLIGSVGRGSVVAVPWRGRIAMGLVLKVSASSEVAAKKIQSLAGLVCAEKMPEDFVGAVEWISRHYFVSPGTSASAFIPQVPKKDIMRLPPKQFFKKRTADRLRLPAGGQIIQYASCEQKFQATAEILKKNLSKKSSAIVIAPHLEDAAAAASDLRKHFGAKRVKEFHGGLKETDFRKTWIALAEGLPAIVVGTRIAALAPVQQLAAVIIQECDSQDLKQYDQNPRFDARETALRRADISGADIFFMGQAPRLEEHQLLESRGFILKESGTAAARAILADASGLGRSGGLLSPAALGAIRRALQRGKKVLIFHNRRGAANALICRDCGYSFPCGTCGISRRPHDGSLRCHRCGTASAAPAVCPRCRGAALRLVGAGTAAMEVIVKKTFPGASIERLDADTRGKTDKERLQKADILIGTGLLLHDLAELITPAPAFGAIIATSLDDLLAHPGFRVSENAWRTVRALRNLAAISDAELYLHAYEPESSSIRTLLADCEAFMRAEFTERKRLLFPPAAEIITISSFGGTEEEARKKSAALRKTITEKFESGPEFSVSGPLRPGAPYRHGRWRQMLIIKTAAISGELEKFIWSLPEEYIMERNPESI